MKLGPKSTLANVARVVGRALKKNGIRAALTGGACAHLYSGGSYSSYDVDFVLLGETRGSDLDALMAGLGFNRRRDRYEHPEVPYFVEFLPGPLALGADQIVTPIEGRKSERGLLILSATDSCRDRLSAFYHWKDRQSLSVAVEIAVRNRLKWPLLEAWSKEEGREEDFIAFRRAVRAARRRQAR